jgi:hypothetical protein
MESVPFLIYHPLIFLLFFSCCATVLAALAWGKPGAINSLLMAPSWGAAWAVMGATFSKPSNVGWDHLNLAEVSKQFLQGTSVWLLAAIPGTLMGLAILELIKKFSRRANSNPASTDFKSGQ